MIIGRIKKIVNIRRADESIIEISLQESEIGGVKKFAGAKIRKYERAR